MDYNTYKFIASELYKRSININNNNKPGVNDINSIEKWIQEHIELLDKYKSDKVQELVDAILERQKIFKDLLINIKDIKTIYYNYLCNLESDKYLKKSKKVDSDLSSRKLEKDEITNKLKISEEDKRNFENDINLLKKEKNEFLDLEKDNQKKIEEIFFIFIFKLVT